VSAEPPRYLLLANPTSGTDEDRALIRRASDTLGDVQVRPVGPGIDPAPDIAAAVSAIVELREARPFALDGELQSPARVLAVRVVPRALNVLVEGGET
jgi:diacylglycerol kinase family enzyme